MLDLVMRGAADAPAILAPGRETLTYGALQDLVTDTIGLNFPIHLD